MIEIRPARPVGCFLHIQYTGESAARSNMQDVGEADYDKGADIYTVKMEM
jgi:hypothetical protein